VWKIHLGVGRFPRCEEASVTFRRIAVVNRGEAAMRLIHAVRDINAEAGGTTQVVALHT